MKLLFDENLSSGLVRSLASVFPRSVHVREADLRGASDRAIWNFARSGEFTIVTKDDDFRELAILDGTPPKVIVLRPGNCPSSEIERVLAASRDAVAEFVAETEAVLEIGRGDW